jgi:RNA polymerase sigma factor (sigma-70 family)|tara:strand:+ start:288 stop:770 length:483 start_codon:yes stop_codon:yes gene_type:complete
MKIPKNMSEEQVYDTIFNIIERISHKYTFHGYEVEDIQQEAFIICVDALNRYDEKRPLENFLSVNLSNRLKNFIRDNHFVKNNNHKKKIKQPYALVSENIINEKFDLDQIIEHKEIFDLIDDQLPSNLREDYLKIINDIPISKSKKEKIFETIRSIVEDA